MHLTLLRHATAEDWETASDDFRRELVERGVAESRAAGDFAKKLGWKPDFVLNSPLTRARQTAELFCVRAELPEPVEAEFLASGMNPESAASSLCEYLKCGHVVIVGHEPDFSGLISFLTGLPQSSFSVAKGSLWGVECNRLAPGAGRLKYSVTPKQLRALGG